MPYSPDQNRKSTPRRRRSDPRLAGYSPPDPIDSPKSRSLFSQFATRPTADLLFNFEWDALNEGYKVFLDYTGRDDVKSIVWIVQKTPFEDGEGDPDLPTDSDFADAVSAGNFHDKETEGTVQDIWINDPGQGDPQEYLILPGETLFYAIRVYKKLGGSGDHSESYIGRLTPDSLPIVEPVYFQAGARPDHEPYNEQVRPTARFLVYGEGLEVKTANGSADPDGSIASYSWDWGDGSPLDITESPTHTYASAGTYEITLTVTDDDGLTDSMSLIVEVDASRTQAKAPGVDKYPPQEVNFSASTSDHYLSLTAADNTVVTAATRRLEITSGKFRERHVGMYAYLDVDGGYTTKVESFVDFNTVVLADAPPTSSSASDFDANIHEANENQRYGYAAVFVTDPDGVVEEFRARTAIGQNLDHFSRWTTVSNHVDPVGLGFGALPADTKLYLVQLDLVPTAGSQIEWEVVCSPPTANVVGYHAFDYDLKAEIKGQIRLDNEHKPQFSYVGDEDTVSVAFTYATNDDLREKTEDEIDALFDAAITAGQVVDGRLGTIPSSSLGDSQLVGTDKFYIAVRPFSIASADDEFGVNPVFNGVDFFDVIESEGFREPIPREDYYQETRQTGEGGADEEWGVAEISVYDPDGAFADFEASFRIATVPFPSVTFYSYDDPDPDSPFVDWSFDAGTSTWSFTLEAKLHRVAPFIVRWNLPMEFPAGVSLGSLKGRFPFDADKHPDCSFSMAHVWDNDSEVFHLRVDWVGDEDTRSVELSLDHPDGGTVEETAIINERTGSHTFDLDLLPGTIGRLFAVAHSELDAGGKAQTEALNVAVTAPDAEAGALKAPFKNQALGRTAVAYSGPTETITLESDIRVALSKGVHLFVGDTQVEVIDDVAGSNVIPIREERVIAEAGTYVVADINSFFAYFAHRPKEIQLGVQSYTEGRSFSQLTAALEPSVDAELNVFLQFSTVSCEPTSDDLKDRDIFQIIGKRNHVPIECYVNGSHPAPVTEIAVEDVNGDPVFVNADKFFKAGGFPAGSPLRTADKQTMGVLNLQAGQISAVVSDVSDNDSAIASLDLRADDLESSVTLTAEVNASGEITSLALVRLDATVLESTVTIGGDKIFLNGDTVVDGTFEVLGIIAGDLVMNASGKITNANDDFVVDQSGFFVESAPTSFVAARAVTFGSNDHRIYHLASDPRLYIESASDHVAVKCPSGRTVTLWGGHVQLLPQSGAFLTIGNLPVSDPGGSGRVWRDANGFVKIT